MIRILGYGKPEEMKILRKLLTEISISKIWQIISWILLLYWKNGQRRLKRQNFWIFWCAMCLTKWQLKRL